MDWEFNYFLNIFLNSYFHDILIFFLTTDDMMLNQSCRPWKKVCIFKRWSWSHYNIVCDFHWNGWSSSWPSIIATVTNPPEIRIAHNIFRFHFGRLTDFTISKEKQVRQKKFFSFSSSFPPSLFSFLFFHFFPFLLFSCISFPFFPNYLEFVSEKLDWISMSCIGWWFLIINVKLFP